MKKEDTADMKMDCTGLSEQTKIVLDKGTDDQTRVTTDKASIKTDRGTFRTK